MLDALENAVGLLGVFDGQEKEAHEPFQAVLVHGVHEEQVRDAEKQLRGATRHGNVAGARLFNFQLRLRCLFYLVFVCVCVCVCVCGFVVVVVVVAVFCQHKMRSWEG